MKIEDIEDKPAESNDGAKLSDEDKAQIQKALSILQPIADRNKCEVAELLGGSSEEPAGEDEAADDEKVGLIVARLKGEQGE